MRPRRVFPGVVALLAVAAPAQQPAAATATAALAGHCRGAAPAPAPPVRITLWLHDERREAATLAGDVFADAAGGFTFATVPWPADGEWFAQYLVLVARQGDRTGLATVRGEPAGRPFPIELVKTATVRGVVRDDEGRPLGGATVGVDHVCTRPVPHEAFFVEPLPAWTATTAADGTFVIAGVPADAVCWLRAAQPGFARARTTASAAHVAEFALAPEAVIAGRVVRADGGRGRTARMRVQAASRDGTSGSALTSDDGSYRLLGLPAGDHQVWIEHDELAAAAIEVPGTAAGSETRAPDLVLIAGGLVSGRVVDRNGKPVRPGPAAHIVVQGPSRPYGVRGERTPIGADGTFRVRVAPGAYHVRLEAKAAGWETVSHTRLDLDVAAGQTAAVEFVLRLPGAR